MRVASVETRRWLRAERASSGAPAAEGNWAGRDCALPPPGVRGQLGQRREGLFPASPPHAASSWALWRDAGRAAGVCASGMGVRPDPCPASGGFSARSWQQLGQRPLREGIGAPHAVPQAGVLLLFPLACDLGRAPQVVRAPRTSLVRAERSAPFHCPRDFLMTSSSHINRWLFIIGKKDFSSLYVFVYLYPWGPQRDMPSGGIQSADQRYRF